MFVSDTNKTPLIEVLTWFLLIASILSVIARAFTKAAVIHFASLNDYLVSTSLVCAPATSSSSTAAYSALNTRSLQPDKHLL